MVHGLLPIILILSFLYSPPINPCYYKNTIIQVVNIQSESQLSIIFDVNLNRFSNYFQSYPKILPIQYIEKTCFLLSLWVLKWVTPPLDKPITASFLHVSSLPEVEFFFLWGKKNLNVTLSAGFQSFWAQTFY